MGIAGVGRLKQPLRGAARSGRTSFWLGCWVILALAAFNLLLGIGSSSLFVDEAFTWTVASAPLADLYAQVKASEVAPPLYYGALHTWMKLGGSESEALMRALSALAGVRLAAAGRWLGWSVAGRRTAILAGLLAALSPLVLRYGQEARAYVFTMVAVTVSVAAATQAVDDRANRSRWLGLAIAGSVTAVWLHYTSLLVVVPLAVWVITRRELSRRAKALYSASIVVAQALVTPIMVSQFAADNPGAARFSRLTLANAIDVLGTPLDGRYPHNALLSAVGAVATLGAVALLLRRRDAVRHAALIAVLTAGPIAALFLVTLLSEDVLLSRYSSVCAPFAIVAIAAAAALVHHRAAVAVVGIVAAFAALGSLASHRTDSNHPDIGSAFDHAGAGWRAGDVLLIAPTSAFDLIAAPLWKYYSERALPAAAEVVAGADSPRLQAAIRKRRRIWILREPPASRASLARALRPIRYRPVAPRTFHGITDVQVLLSEPLSR